jgi:hypothetical protein
MPSRAAFIQRRSRDPLFDQRAKVIIGGRSLQKNSGRKPITAATWVTFLQQLPLLSVPKLVAIEGMPSMAAVYQHRRLDPVFRKTFDGIVHDPQRERERHRESGERLSLLRTDPDFCRKMYLARSPAAAGVVALCYPYIIRARPEHADILEVNNLIPRTFDSDRRADICQELLLAILEGRMTMQQLRARRDDAVFFIKKFWRDNFEQSGHAVSFDRLDDDRSYDEVASAIAAKDWHAGEMNDRRRHFDAMRGFQPPTQIDDVYYAQVHRKHFELSHLGLSFDEVEDALRASSV